MMQTDELKNAIDEENYDDIMYDIAIIGMAGRFPKAKSIEELWQNLLESRECVTFHTDEEILASGVKKQDLESSNFVKANILFEDIENFDAQFFEFNPREAEVMDPQHRLGLECAYHALENAGIDPERSNGTIGVFAGVGVNSYFLFNVFRQVSEGRFGNYLQAQIAFDKDYFSTQIAYKLNLTGPVLNIDTTCSTSLVATHVACQSLLNGECRVALAGGSNLSKPRTLGYHYAEGGYESIDGHCRAFDAKARGTIGGHGVAFVVLKRLEDAIKDRDQVVAVIKGSAVNNDGSAKIGFTAPSVEGQMKVVAEAQAVTGIDVETIRYIEAHGTGTQLGDPIELTALTRAFRISTEKNQFCAIGSIKPNIGHLGAAAGVASLVKTALILKHKIIPQSINYNEPNPNIDFENSPFFVNDKLRKIDSYDEPIRAGINSLGIGGTNAHIIMEEPPVIKESGPSRHWQLLMLSAKTKESLDEMTYNLKEHLKKNEDQKIADSAYTLQTGRKEFDFRRFFLVEDGSNKHIGEIIDPFSGFTSKASEEKNRIIFMFPGGGTQYINMGKNLYETEDTFRKTLDECSKIIEETSGFNLIKLLYPAEEEETANRELLNQPKAALPALFSIEYSLAQLIQEWGIQPDALMGHSLGEYVAACMAGVIDLKNVLGLVCLRGQLFQKIENGGMLSVSITEDKLKEYMIPDLSIAAINGPERCVVAGHVDSIKAMEKKLSAKDIEYRMLHIDAPGHSQMVEQILDEFGEYFKGLTLQAPQMPYISNVTGTWITADEATDPEYWKKHLRLTVRFGDGVREVLKENNTIMLEIGPGNALSSFARLQMDIHRGHTVINMVRHPKENRDDAHFLFEAIGKLWLRGVEIDWAGFYKNEQRNKAALPLYPFQKLQYWIESSEPAGVGDEKIDELHKLDISKWYWVPVWKNVPLIARFRNAVIEENIETPQNVLLFSHEKGLGEQLVSELEELKYNITRVISGKEYAQVDTELFRIDPENREDYTKLFEDLKQSEHLPDKIIHLLTLNEKASQKTKTGYFSHNAFIYLAQAIGDVELLQPLDIFAVTNNLENVTGGETIDAWKSLITGPAKVIPYEYPNLSFRIVDAGADFESDQHLAENIANEIITLTDDSVIAYRKNRRWVKDYSRVMLPEAPVEQAKIEKDKVYLITGGLGGMGLVLAEHISSMRVKLLLLTRSDFPKKTEWNKVLTSDKASKETKSIIEKLLLIEKNGSEVFVLKGDLSGEKDVAALFATTRKKHKKIDGVFHCAGLNDGAVIQSATAELTEKVFGPKVNGTNYLFRELETDKPDFVVLCSSLSAVTSAYGGVDYVSANAYLDAYAQENSKKAFPVISINWDIWEEVGMSARNEDKPEYVESKDDIFIYPDEGAAVFINILFASLNQVIVSTRDFGALHEKNKVLNRTIEPEPEEEVDAERAALYDRPNLSSTYVAPNTEIEKILAGIWEKALGIANIGVHDNFFELGGESLLGVQISAKARNTGINVTPKELFQNPTIHLLAKKATLTSAIPAEQGLVYGEAELSPVQHAFFSIGMEEESHWNMSMIFDLQKSIDKESLKKIAVAMIMHHDTLRMRIKKTGDSSGHELKQEFVGVDDRNISEVIDLSGKKESDVQSELPAIINQLQTTLDIYDGPVFRLVFIKTPAKLKNKLVLIMHHLVADGFSSRFLIEDLITSLKSIRNKKEPQLPQKTTSFKEYIERLYVLARSEEIAHDFEYWRERFSQPVAEAPKDIADGANSEEHAAAVFSELSAEETESILHEIPKKLNLKINEVLIVALARVIEKWCGSNNVLLNVVGHGRDDLLDNIDLSRTAGWFGDGNPVVLTLTGKDDLLNDIIDVKDQLRTMPHYGLSFGMLKHISGDREIQEKMKEFPNPEFTFNYLGQFDQVKDTGSELIISDEKISGLCGGKNKRRVLHDVLAMIVDGTLKIEWKYSDAVYKEQTIAKLLKNLQEEIKAVIEFSTSVTGKVFTISDFPLVSLTKEKLAEITDAYEVEDIINTSPMQEVMLKESLKDNTHRSYVIQSVYDFKMKANFEEYKQAWQILVERHKNFRTTFVQDDDGSYIQVINERMELPIIEMDWTDLSPMDKETEFQKLLETDRKNGFNFEKDSPMRVHFIHLDKANNFMRLLLTNHQATIDGWTSGLTFTDLAKVFMSIVNEKELPSISQFIPFKHYMEWLNGQSKASCMQYWNDELKNMKFLSYLASLERKKKLVPEEVDTFYGNQMLVLDQELSAKIRDFANNNKITISTVFQGCWALVLHKISKQQDIMFGVTVSGRQIPLEDVTDVVGQCSNSLPLAISINEYTVEDWLNIIQKKNIMMRENINISIDDIKREKGIAEDELLYETNVIFENLPIPDVGEDRVDAVQEFFDSYFIDAWHFPMRLFVFPMERYTIRIAYDRVRFESESVMDVIRQMEYTLRVFVEDNQRSIVSFWEEKPDTAG